MSSNTACCDICKKKCRCDLLDLVLRDSMYWIESQNFCGDFEDSMGATIDNMLNDIDGDVSDLKERVTELEEDIYQLEEDKIYLKNTIVDKNSEIRLLEEQLEIAHPDY